MLRKLWNKWKAFGAFIGNIVARVVLSVFYFTIFVPFGIGTRLFSDRLGIKTIPKEFWHPRPDQADSIEKARAQT